MDDGTQDVRKNAIVELEIEKLAFGGKALAHVNGLVVFVDGAIPGQRVRAQVVRKKRQFAEARMTEVLTQSPDWIEPFCPHFGVCGGCTWQNLSYGEQIRWKRLHVMECLQHLAGVDDSVVAPTVPSPNETYYRNKMEFTFADRRWLMPEEIAAKDVVYERSFALGLHARGAFDKVFNVEQCFLESRRAVEILVWVREWSRQSGLGAYTTRTHEGFWRFLVIREGKRTGQTLVHIITASHPKEEEVVDALVGGLLEQFPEITTVIHSINRKKAQVAIGDDSRVVMGPGYIEEHLGDVRFQISAHSFFQTNPCAAEMLYETVRDFGEFSGGETVWDLYCGTGSIALFIANRVRRVIGFEVVGEAIADAYRNCELNGIDNCRFFLGDLKDEIVGAQGKAGCGDPPDVVITDPPRAGMHPGVVKALLVLSPKRIIVVSCNPSTLARDLSMLRDRYEVRRIKPFDLFPHTAHIECVAQLDRIG